MSTPIYSFLKGYAESGVRRMHMPGHKGVGLLGAETLDITEIKGADSLFEASGIIRQSEENASRLFGANTFYSTEGSSLSIRAMVYLTSLYAKSLGRTPRILSARNCHRAFLSAVALTDVEVEWLENENFGSYLCAGDASEQFLKYLDAMGDKELPTALYITSPDYLGNMQNIARLSDLCHGRGMLLLVDNAHGAYLKFLGESMHPIDLGADMCADSAHKTLPALTGASYLHISKSAPSVLYAEAKRALSLFASTSPSYLILASLDLLNERLNSGYGDSIRDFAKTVENCKQLLTKSGFTVVGNEPMKITVFARDCGYMGVELAEFLRDGGVECEFADADYLTLMPSAVSGVDLHFVSSLFEKFNARKTARVAYPQGAAPSVTSPERVISVKEAMTSLAEEIPACESLGRVVCDTALACPPAVPILMPGERICKDALAAFEYYGIKTVRVVAR